MPTTHMAQFSDNELLNSLKSWMLCFERACGLHDSVRPQESDDDVTCDSDCESVC